jgi:hypothetical protein
MFPFHLSNHAITDERMQYLNTKLQGGTAIGLGARMENTHHPVVILAVGLASFYSKCD